MRTAFVDELTALAADDPAVMLLTGDLGYSVLEGFAERFGGRYVNVGVAEQNLIGVCAGLAMTGFVPYAYSIANFPSFRCLEQVRNDVCYHGLGVKIVAVGSGLAYGALGYTHHGIEDVAVMRALPGMTVVVPGDPAEARAAARAVRDHDGPCYIRLGKAGERPVHEAPPRFSIGEALTVRPGSDVSLVATGSILAEVVDAAAALAAEGIDARVLSMHTISPLDRDAVAACARETAAIVTVEEHSVTGGLGSAVAEALADAGFPARLRRLGLPPVASPAVGGQAYLRERNGLHAAGIADAVRAMLAG